MLIKVKFQQGNEFYSLISSPQNSGEIPSKVLTSLLVDLHSNEIALKGNGFDEISYRFLGTVIIGQNILIKYQAFIFK